MLLCVIFVYELTLTKKCLELQFIIEMSSTCRAQQLGQQLSLARWLFYPPSSFLQSVYMEKSCLCYQGDVRLPRSARQLLSILTELTRAGESKCLHEKKLSHPLGSTYLAKNVTLPPGSPYYSRQM